MGLTIHYKLQFTGTVEEAIKKLGLFRNRAMDTSFHKVSEVKHFIDKDECNWNLRPADDEWRWALIQAQGERIRIAPDGHRLKKKEQSYVGCISVYPQAVEAVIFRAWAGEGCEVANFGLCRYEPFVNYEGKTYRIKNTGWTWGSFCKTQYASETGMLNFLRCHTLIISMLDYTKELGILKEVYDEGEYWENRNLKELAEEVGRWNSFIAGISGSLGQMFGGGKVESVIAHYPDYELLKEIGMQHLAEQKNGKVVD